MPFQSPNQAQKEFSHSQSYYNNYYQQPRLAGTGLMMHSNLVGESKSQAPHAGQGGPLNPQSLVSTPSSKHPPSQYDL